MRCVEEILILGTGNFSDLLLRILKDDFRVQVLSGRNASDTALNKAVEQTDAIILSIPLEGYSCVLNRVASSIQQDTLIVDVCSVKEKSQKIVHDPLPDHCEILITHPLFGPDSAANGTSNLDLVVCEEVGEKALFFVDYCENKLKLNIVRMSAKEHDTQMATTQALTFFISETLKDMGITQQRLMTPSYEKLLSVRELADRESQDLLNILQKDNNYATPIRKKFLDKSNGVDKKYSDKIEQ